MGADEIAPGAVGAEEIAAGAVRRSEIDGAEVRLYRVQPGCGGSPLPTFDTMCTTNFCSPLPIPLFNTCSGVCISPIPETCANEVVGFLLSPNIE